MRLVVFVIALFCSVWTFSQSDFETVQLRLPKDAVYTYSQIEPSIAIDPNNPKHIAVGSVLSDYYYSTNGGKKWKSKM